MPQAKLHALRIEKAFGIAAEEIDIRPTATTMLENIGHAFADGHPVYDTTFENVQAGLRTDYLFRLANHQGAIVVGTAGMGQLFTQAVVNRGALGVVSTQKAPAYLDPSPDLTQWGSISYDETHKGFAFRATPRAAAALKAATASGSDSSIALADGLGTPNPRRP